MQQAADEKVRALESAANEKVQALEAAREKVQMLELNLAVAKQREEDHQEARDHTTDLRERMDALEINVSASHQKPGNSLFIYFM
jgi:dihydroorotate dehydrogenase